MSNNGTSTPTTRRTISRKGATAIVGGALLVALGVTATATASTFGGPAPRTAISATASTTATADAALVTALQYSREEERLARDVYAALAARYDGAVPFSMITRSEQVHYDAIGTLLTRYGISDPSVGRPAGSYADPTLQKLYDTLMAQGAASLGAAYDVGVAIEKQDIADLDRTLAGALPADVKAVLTNLRSGSEHHLAAFENAADGTATGGGYGRMAGGTPGNGAAGGGRYGMGNGMANGGQRGAMNGTGDCLLTGDDV